MEDVSGEILRKAVHVGTGILMVLLYSFFKKDILIFIHLFFLFFVWFFEFRRLKGAIKVPFLRDTEEKQVGSHAFFMLGTWISVLAFDADIAIASIFMLTIGDPASSAAHLLSKGSSDLKKHRDVFFKPPCVILTMFIVSCSMGYLFLGSLAVAAVGGLGASLADGIRLKVYNFVIDDNLTIPLYAGMFMSLASMN